MTNIKIDNKQKIPEKTGYDKNNLKATKKQKSLSIAKKLLELGIGTVDEIIEVTGLTVEDIKILQERIQK